MIQKYYPGIDHTQFVRKNNMIKELDARATQKFLEEKWDEILQVANEEELRRLGIGKSKITENFYRT